MYYLTPKLEAIGERILHVCNWVLYGVRLA